MKEVKQYLAWSADYDMTEDEAMEMKGEGVADVAERFAAGMDEGDLPDRGAPFEVHVRCVGSEHVHTCKVRAERHVEYDVVEQTCAKVPPPEDDD